MIPAYEIEIPFPLWEGISFILLWFYGWFATDKTQPLAQGTAGGWGHHSCWLIKSHEH